MYIEPKLRAAGPVARASQPPGRSARPSCARASGKRLRQRRQLCEVRPAAPEGEEAALVAQLRQLYLELEQVRQAGVPSAEIRSALAQYPLNGPSWHQVLAACHAGAGWDHDLLYLLRCHAQQNLQAQLACLPGPQRALFAPLLEMLASLERDDKSSALNNMRAFRAHMAAADTATLNLGIVAALAALDEMLLLADVVVLPPSKGEWRQDDHSHHAEVAKKNYSAARRALADACKRETTKRQAQRIRERRASSEALRQIYLRAWRQTLALASELTQPQRKRG